MPTTPTGDRDVGKTSYERLAAIRTTVAEPSLLPDPEPRHEPKIAKEEYKQANEDGGTYPAILLLMPFNVAGEQKATNQTDEEENDPNCAAFARLLRHLALISNKLVFGHREAAGG